MKRYVKVNNQSIETSGITKDYQCALCEFIWNGFEANASIVKITYTVNELNGIDTITVIDDGEGIVYDTIDNTFGAFLASQKNETIGHIKYQDNKGKGRFSFVAFASLAEWHTAYKKDDEIYEFNLTLTNGEKNAYEISLPEKSNKSKTGTKVVFTNIYKLSLDDMLYKNLESTFLREFSWYLYLNKENNLKLNINGADLDFKKYVDEELSEEKVQRINEFDFYVDLIVWKEKIDEKFLTYYLNSENEVIHIETTTFNRNTVGFNHSVIVKSTCFDNYAFPDNESLDQIRFDGNEKVDKAIKSLHLFIQEFIDSKLRDFLNRRSDIEIERMETRGSFPRFSDDIYGEMRKKDFKRVTKELYCLDTRIFYKLKPIQEKSFLGFLNLLLSSEERQNILDIIESIVKLTPNQRKNFSDILKKTKLENILDSIKLIEDRYAVIEALKKLIYDAKIYSNERDHIQRIIEQHFWLFGEQYNLVTADERMQNALEKYLYILDGVASDTVPKLKDSENLRRMDIFLCSKRKVEDVNETELEENLIVELKAPKIVLSKKIYRQIEDYMDYIRKHKEFNSSLRRWKFITVCAEVDNDIKSRYIAFKDKGKKFLVSEIDNYEIYAMTWDDVFKSFDIRHGFLLDRLQYDRDKLATEMEKEMKADPRESADKITLKVVNK